MNWTAREGIDYEDAKRPTADEPTNATGWVAYYAWGRGGGGIHTPHYLYAPGWTDFDDLREWIVHQYESWLEHAEYAGIAIHRGVVPPLEVVEREYKEACERVDRAVARCAKLLEELTKARTKE